MVGLGTMGRALAEALARSGFEVHVVEPLDAAPHAFGGVTIHADLASMASALVPPRRILMMVTAGGPVDSVIASLKTCCSAGDILIDGGNSFFRDTERRAADLAGAGLRYLGAGISGGEEGARNGASVMVGGEAEIYAAAEDILTAIAARRGDHVCCARVGPGGAGHVVKMVHNGIEYALMQAVAEAHFLLHRGAGLSHDAIASVFRGWNTGVLESYLLGIAADILTKQDPEIGGACLDVLDDRARESGTGRWVVTEAMALGVPVPSIAEAVAARSLSRQADIRAALAGDAECAPFEATDAYLVGVRAALTGCMVAAFAQGISILSAAGVRDAWSPDLANIARIWRKGCIIQGKFLETIEGAFSRQQDLPHLLMDSDVAALIADAAPGWRETASGALAAGLPMPVIAASLGWYDALCSGRLWTALVQAQRDYFGRHGLTRTDRPGLFHANWRG